MRRSMVAMIALLTTTAAVPAAAQDDIKVIQLRRGGEQIIRFKDDRINSVNVGDSDVADVTPKSDRIIVVVGKKVGTTDLIVFSMDRDIYHATITVGAPPLNGKVFMHSKHRLNEYWAYQCAPVCNRIEDALEGPPLQAPIIVESRGSSNITISPPPAAAAGAPAR